MTRYFLGTDNSSHWYLVPAEKREEWNAWRDLDEDDERSWKAPDYARRLSQHPTWMTFTDPQEEP